MSEELAVTDDNSVEVVICGPNANKTMMCGDVYFVNGKARLPANIADAKMRSLRRYYQCKYAHEVAAEAYEAEKKSEAEQKAEAYEAEQKAEAEKASRGGRKAS